MRHAKTFLIATAFGGMMGLAGAAFGQTVDVHGATAGSTAKTLSGVTGNGDNPTAGKAVASPSGGSGVSRKQAVIVPKHTGNGAGNMAPLNGDESGVAQHADTKNAGPAARSAEATAHKTVYDPNNQLGTSLKGTTGPDAGTANK